MGAKLYEYIVLFGVQTTNNIIYLYEIKDLNSSAQASFQDGASRLAMASS
jgi:hypothetical protein